MTPLNFLNNWPLYYFNKSDHMVCLNSYFTCNKVCNLLVIRYRHVDDVKFHRLFSSDHSIACKLSKFSILFLKKKKKAKYIVYSLNFTYRNEC